MPAFRVCGRQLLLFDRSRADAKQRRIERSDFIWFHYVLTTGTMAEYSVPNHPGQFTESEINSYRAAFGAIANQLTEAIHPACLHNSKGGMQR
jgi:hypothetical protein